LPDLASNPRYETVRLRAEHADELIPRLRKALAARTALEWEALFGERVPCAPAREIEDMFDHPQVQAEGMVHSFEHPVAGRYRGLSGAFKFGNAAPPTPRPAPTFGQHSDEVLAIAGYSVDEITRLREAGALH
jgi:formyl-CoA transferase